METYEARLDSFGPAKTSSKKRNSTAKGGKGPKWPHDDPSPASLAQTGFYYDPNEVSGDRVTCCLCQTVLDGWEANDDPIKEHFNYSPNCAIAIHAKIEQDVEAGIPIEKDPTSEEMLDARKATFRDLWPHEKKRGWTCKTQKMAEAGWYYCPTSESDDFVKCAYCGLSLDGWEPKDKPYDEHERRSAKCTFFSFQQPTKAKSSRTKKGRTSKASRLSTQSTTTIPDDTAMIEVTVDDGDMVLTTATEATQASTSKAKKGGRTKKNKSRSKAATAPLTESAPASSMIEPEDDDFEVKVVVPASKPKRARKRKSDEMDVGNEEETEAPAPKRRGTRARTSTAQAGENKEGSSQPLMETPMADAEEAPTKPAPKKNGKRATRARASSTTRKASATSTASNTTQYNTEPADEEIEAALEADLDRPLTDEEAASPPKPAPRSRAASRSQTKKAASVVAPIRQGARESTISTATMQTANEELSTMLNADEALGPVAPIKIPKQRTTRKGKVQQETSVASVDNVVPDVSSVLDQPADAAAAEVAVPKGRGRQPSRKASRQVSRQKATQKKLEASAEIPRPAPEIGSAEVTMIHAPQEDIGDSQENGNKRGKRVVSATKKGKSKASTMNVEIVMEAVAESQGAQEPTVQDTVKDTNHLQSEPSQAKAKATRGRPKKKATREPDSQPTEKAISKSTEATDATQAPRNAPKEPHAPSQTPIKPSSVQQIPSPTPSPQSSDAENQPPSSRPSATRPPLIAPTSPIDTRVPLAASTPTAARTNLNPSKLSTTFPWTSVDLDYALVGTPGAVEQENIDFSLKFVKAELTSPEKRMTVEQWIHHQATLGQERLRSECERIVQGFENEGVRALKALEGIVAE